MLREKTQKQGYSITQVIDKHLLSLLHDTSVSLAVFVSNVREHYEATHLLHSRSIEWSQVADPVIRMTRDAEKFKRWLEQDGSKQLPIDLYDSIVAAFPAERKFSLQIELIARLDLVPVQMPTSSVDELASFGNIAKKTGQTMIVVAKLYEDGVIDKNDMATAPEALSTIDEAIAALLAMKNTINVNVYGEKA
ncbi:hypothetical protein [Methylocucumis oryzae]|uniref:Uncharacterized protein n=1 Tax=Methylocucumis oryzae TaxID=1632867 RepID=A0A0F3IMU2_9GAMM|nr:hypothetical protein [Methylocucumis oryzae]KJV08012.1 hypothetical protein VZ94_00935 [Methylocucumis oryzae]